MTKKKTVSKKSAPKALKKASKPAAKPLKKAAAKKIVPITKKKNVVKAPAKSKKPLLKKISKPAPKKSAKKPSKASTLKKPIVKKVVQKAKVPSKGTPKPPLAIKSPTSASKPKAKVTLSKAITSRGALQQTFVTRPIKKNHQNLSPFLAKQRQRLLQLKDTLLDSMNGVARGNLHAGSDASGFGMHQADAGSDAYDRDFALSILSQEQNSLYEIDEALKRIDDGTYGICEISNKQILHARLEARPFTRYTVECQAELEKRQHVSGARVPVSALFGITEEENENEEEEGFNDNPKD